MPNLNISVTSRKPFGAQTSGARGLESLITYLQAARGGQNPASAVFYSRNDTTGLSSSNLAGQAVAGFVFATGTGDETITINGTDITATWATSDTATMTALMTAIRASSSLNQIVTATNILGKLTLASVAAGTTVRIFGIPFKAVTGTPVNFGDFDISGSDTADATSLTLAINRHPSLSGVCRAVSDVGAVYVGFCTNRNPTSAEKITNPSASTITVNTATPVAGGVGMVLCTVPGVIGNCITAAVTGTNLSLITTGTAKLGSGMGGGTALAVIIP